MPYVSWRCNSRSDTETLIEFVVRSRTSSRYVSSIVAKIFWINACSTLITLRKTRRFSMWASQRVLLWTAVAANGMARGPGWAGQVKTVVEMSEYYAVIRTRTRWSCVPPPRCEYTERAFALILFHNLWTVSYVGLPWIGVRLACSK